MDKINIIESLDKIWSSEYMTDSIEYLKERGYCYSSNESQKDILICGINPSFRKGAELGNGSFSLSKILDELKRGSKDNYWSVVKRMVIDEDESIFLDNKVAYLDVFYFRETDQKVLQKEIIQKEKLLFIIDQLVLTQNIIEEIIKPKVIVLKNKEVYAYFGFYANTKKWIWMGYDMEECGKLSNGDSVYEIKGMIDANERINKRLEKTALIGTKVILSSHGVYTAKEKRLTASVLKSVL